MRWIESLPSRTGERERDRDGAQARFECMQEGWRELQWVTVESGVSALVEDAVPYGYRW